MTKSETTVKAVEAMRAEITRMASAEVTDAELQLAKDAIIKGAAFDNDSTTKIIRRLMNYEYYGLPANFLEQYRASVEKTTKADVLRVAKQTLADPSRFVTLVLGNPVEIGTGLTKLGTVHEIEIAIPPPGATARPTASAAPAPDAEQRGRQLLARAREAHGGAKLAAVKDLTTVTKTTVKTPQGDITLQSETSVNLDTGKTIAKSVTPVGEVVQGFDGASVWIRGPQGIQTAPASAAQQAKASIARQNIMLLRGFDKGYQIAAVADETIETRKLPGVQLTSGPGEATTLFFDPATGLLAAKRYVGQVVGPPGELTEIYTQTGEFDGVKIPVKGHVLQGGQTLAETETSSMKVNPGLADSAYAKPAQ
jgi:hypothetical protein